MNTKIKNNLFSFTTLRNPEKLEEEKKVQFFIYMPDDGDSPAVSLLRTNDTEDFEENLNNFEPLTYLQLKSDNPNFYKWSFYIYHNRQSITSTRFIEKYNQFGLATESAPTMANKMIWWDNFIYQLDVQNRPNYNLTFEKDEDADAREAVMILIYGSYLLETFTVTTPSEGDPFISLAGESNPVSDKLFKRILQARIVEPEFIQKLSTQGMTNTRMAQYSSFETLSIAAQGEISNIWKGYKAREVLNRLRNLEKELKKAFKVYQRLENDQRTTYENQYEILYNDFLIEFETDPEVVPPVYDYTPLVELDDTRLQQQLSETSIFLFSGLIEEETHTFQDVFELLNQSIAEQEKQTELLAQETSKIVGFKGVLFPTVTTSNIPNNTYMIGAVQHQENVWSWIMIVKINSDTHGIHSLEYDLYESNLISSQLASKVVNHGNGIFVISLYEEGLDLLSFPGQLTLEATITTMNQQIFTLDNVITLNSNTFGLLQTENEVGGANLRTTGGNIAAPAHDRKTGITRLGIAEYKRVEQSVCCYLPGEVAHIENVMANEFKEKTVKSTKTAESTQTVESSSEKEQTTDIASTSRNEMQQEIASIIQQSKDFNFNSSASGGLFGWNFSINSGFAMHNSKEQSNNMSLSRAQEITEKAVEKILSKTRQERTTRSVEEYSEESKHGIDNRENPKHIAGVYRWIDKVYKNEIFNYGKRLMYEFMIPEPARFHHLWVNNTKPKEELVIEKPLDPREEIADFGALNEYNYIKWASIYNAEVDAPPAEWQMIGAAYSGLGENGKASHSFNDLRIVEGYKCVGIYCRFNFKKHLNNNTVAHVLVADSVRKITRVNTSEGHEASTTSWNISNSVYSAATIPVSIVTWDVGAFALNLHVSLLRTDELFKQWKLTTFNTIMEAYYSRLEKYNEIIEQYKTVNVERRNTNPGFYREIEQVLLKKSCISYLLGHDNMGSIQFYNGDSLATLNINREGLYEYAEIAKFLEQAFEWEIMGYIFYPFYWAHKNRWEELYSQNSIYYDDTFVKFMESGMARVIVTVRPGFEDAVNWFLEKGEIWNGSTPPVVGDELFLSIVDELQEPEYDVEGSWETRVPTNFMLIQKGTVGLNAEGLPCECTKVYDENGNLVSGSPDLIYQENPEGVGYWIVNPDPTE